MSDANKSLASSMMIKIRVHTFIFCSDSDQPLAIPTLPLSRSDAPFLWPFTFPCSHPSARQHLPAAQVALFWGVLASFLRSPAGCLISVLFSEKLQPEGDAFSCRPVTVLFALGTYSVPPELCLVGICKLRGSWPADQRAHGSVRGQGNRSRLFPLGAGAGRGMQRAAGRLLPGDGTVQFGGRPSFPRTCQGCQPQV